MPFSESSPGEEPAYIQELQRLRERGGPETIQDWITNKTPVFVKRSSGAWQKATVFENGAGGLLAGVQWEDENGKKVGKHVKAEDLLNWQEEALAAQQQG